MPKQKITKQVVLQGAFSLIQKEGIQKFNARNLAKQINCSVQPLYSYFSNIETLIYAVYDFSTHYYNQYIDNQINPTYLFQSIGKGHINFAYEEGFLFQFLFLSPYLHAIDFEDLCHKIERTDVTQNLRNTLHLNAIQAEDLYMNMMLYTHGIACLIATKAATIRYDEMSERIDRAYFAFLQKIQEEKNAVTHP
ncbi:MAG TPA: hypothetical protein DEP42_07235 [Ruminococcaceae bacterium]|nr:hypothetical protein [Oscillospiraceae bacterium]